VTGPACSEAATGVMTGVMTGATGVMTGVMTGATGGTTGATGGTTGKTGVVAAPGCSGNREPDDQGGHGTARTVP
jgi:hypothetical protein